jgi:hypothetical protein
MGDDERALEAVGPSRRRPALWIGGWALGLVAIVGMAVVGRGTTPTGVQAPPPVAAATAGVAPPVPSPAPLAAASAGIPAEVPRIVRPPGARLPASPRPLPTLGDDGLVGGTAYSSAPPAE